MPRFCLLFRTRFRCASGLLPFQAACSANPGTDPIMRLFPVAVKRKIICFGGFPQLFSALRFSDLPGAN